MQIGGLLNYGPNVPKLFRRSATYVAKILKGAKPIDLPMQQPTILLEMAQTWIKLAEQAKEREDEK
jgi:ABC-type uncharacterized transport system substrate-binding protein